MAVSDKDVFSFSEFAGLRNTVDPAEMDPSDLVTALNVDITDSRRIRRRKGFGAAVVSGACHSFWSNGAQAYMVRAGELLQVMPDFTVKVLRAGLTISAPTVFDIVGERVFFSNGHENGVIEDGVARPWGLAVPSLPAAAKIPGSLRAGRYQYVTTVSDQYGQESGATRSGIIELTEPSGLAFSSFGAVPDNAARINLYLSQPDGDVLYLADELHPAATLATVTAPIDGVAPLSTQFLSPPPAGARIVYSYGRMYVADGQRVYPSEPYAPELFDLRKHYPTEALVTMLATVTGGLFVGTETEVGWINGVEPDKSEFIQKAPHGVIPGTLAYGPTDDFSDTAGGIVAYFATTDGVMRGLPGGQLENLTRARYQYPTAVRGAGVVRTTGGVAQYLAVLQG